MKLKITNPFWQVIGLGMLAGMRSNSAPAIASYILSRRQSDSNESDSTNFLRSDKLGMTLKGIAVAEVATNLSPKKQGVRPFGLISRCVSGSLVGASVYKATGGSVLIGSILGGATALGASLASVYLQRDADSKKYVMDPVIVALEDALVIGAGISVISMA